MRVFAPAKLTLSLRVLGRRPDGYHDLDALVTSIGVRDELELRRTESPGVRLTVSGPAAAGVPTDETNLVVRAVQLLDGAEVGFDIALHKEIRPAAGLGGGSTDAAAALRGIDLLLGRHLDDDALAELGARLGADVPFCLRGGTAWMRGRGERLELLAPLDAPLLIVAVPPFGLPTPAVYATWDDLGGPRSERICPPPPALAGLLPMGLVNDLEPAAEAVEPRLRPFREGLEELVGSPVVLAGSGSAYFAVASSAVPTVAEAEAAQQLLAEIEGGLAGTRALVTLPSRGMVVHPEGWRGWA